MQKATRFGLERKDTAILVIAIIGIGAVLSIFSVLLGGQFGVSSSTNAVPQGLWHFQNYSELQNFIDANAKSAQQYSRNGFSFGGPSLPLGGPAMFSANVAGAASTQSPTFTGTNVQVQGVDEPDRVKTDGTHLFVSTTNSVAIMNAYPPNSLSMLSTIIFQNANVLGIEIDQNRLLVINERNANTSYIDLLLYNTSNLSSPQLLENESIAGNYVAARLAQGYLYAVIQQPSYQFDNGGNASGVMPSVIENGAQTILEPYSVYYTPNRAQISYYTMVISVSMSTGKNSVVSVLTGPSSTIYVSPSNIYVVYTNYQEFYADGIPGDVFTGGAIPSTSIQQAENSTIFRASYSNGTVTVEAAGSVPGTVLNQFSMDEYNSYFRVATSRFAMIGGINTRSDDIYVLGPNMSQVSTLQNIAPGENIYAVRFVGDMGYVVTFEQIDPLFAISFQDMSNPVILSALKVTGFSDYLYPLPGGYLIGVGKDAVPSSTGNFAWYLGLKLSLFHVFDNGTSIQVSKYLIGDRGTDSAVLNDHLAFTFDSSRNIMVIPVLLAVVSGNKTYSSNSPPPYGEYVWQGVYVFNVTSSGFTLLGRVSQYPAGQNYGDSPVGNLQIDRSVIIGNYLYTISQGEVMVSDLSSFSTLATVALPGN
jgi:inhibitor of cysteine peptidase